MLQEKGGWVIRAVSLIHGHTSHMPPTKRSSCRLKHGNWKHGNTHREERILRVRPFISTVHFPFSSQSFFSCLSGRRESTGNIERKKRQEETRRKKKKRGKKTKSIRTQTKEAIGPLEGRTARREKKKNEKRKEKEKPLPKKKDGKDMVFRSGQSVGMFGR
mmetsp:Transcript_30429/g.78774  ORF Transcript_30429/g.78774 Transcript_30429/m.78774 type:complete len:161 (+) Transcript_30429:785-1267(+)